MEDTLDIKIEDFKIDKSNWSLVKFGDVAIQQKKSVDRENTDLTKYVKGEHMGSEDLHLREWGELTDEYLGPAFIRRFEEGDILYGSRRTYLRKVVIAPFSGITSNTTFVIKANEKKIDKRLLPFIMMSEGFADNSIKNSKGSVNPYINWKDIANYEFLLPPKEQQAKLAELLWAMDAVVEKEVGLLRCLEASRKSVFHHSLYIKSENFDENFGRLKCIYDVKQLGTLLTEIQYGISESLDEIGAVPVLRMNNLQNGRLDINDLKYYSPKNNELEKFILDKGDVLFNRTNSYELVGKVSIFNEEAIYSFASYLIRLKTSGNRLDSRFLNFYLNSAIGLAKIRKYRTPGVSQSNINAQNIKSVPIPLADIKIQKKIMDKIDNIQTNEDSLISQISASQSLQKSLINQIF